MVRNQPGPTAHSTPHSRTHADPKATSDHTRAATSPRSASGKYAPVRANFSHTPMSDDGQQEHDEATPLVAGLE